MSFVIDFFEENKKSLLTIALCILSLMIIMIFGRRTESSYNYKLSVQEWERQKRMNTLIELYKLKTDLK